MIAKWVVWVFALVSVAEHRTTVRRPTRKKLPDFGWQATRTAPSTPSLALTVYRTRIRRALRGARTSLFAAPMILGGVRSNSNPGTTRVPLYESRPRKPAPFERWSIEPAPEAPANVPDPPVTVKVSVPSTGEGGLSRRQSEPLT